MRRQKREQENDALCDPVSLEIFTTWYAFGGTQRGLSPVEVLSMPAWLRQDFLLIQNYIGNERDNVKRFKPKKKTVKRR